MLWLKKRFMLISICSSFCINETNTSDNLQPLKYQKHHSTGKYFENLSALFLFLTVAESIYFCMQTLNLSSLSQRCLFSDRLFSGFLPFANTADAAGAIVQDVTCGTTLPAIGGIPGNSGIPGTQKCQPHGFPVTG